MTEEGLPITVRIPGDMLRALDDYRGEQPEPPERPDAILQLLKVALNERWKWQG